MKRITEKLKKIFGNKPKVDKGTGRIVRDAINGAIYTPNEKEVVFSKQKSVTISNHDSLTHVNFHYRPIKSVRYYGDDGKLISQ